MNSTVESKKQKQNPDMLKRRNPQKTKVDGMRLTQRQVSQQ